MHSGIYMAVHLQCSRQYTWAAGNRGSNALRHIHELQHTKNIQASKQASRVTRPLLAQRESSCDG
jgi:hypothetical protein